MGSRLPAPKIYQEAMRQLGVRPEEAAFVGDGNDRELEGAKAAGLTTFWINREAFRAIETEQRTTEAIDYTIRSLLELPHLLSIG